MTTTATRPLRTAPLETPTDLKPNAVKDISAALNLCLPTCSRFI
jgi:hypothetical protein